MALRDAFGNDGIDGQGDQFASSEIENYAKMLDTLSLHPQLIPLLENPDNFPINPIALRNYSARLFDESFQEFGEENEKRVALLRRSERGGAIMAGISSLYGPILSLALSTPLGMVTGVGIGAGASLFTGAVAILGTARAQKSKEILEAKRLATNVAQAFKKSLEADTLFQTEIKSIGTVEHDGSYIDPKEISFKDASQIFLKGFFAISRGEREIFKLDPKCHSSEVDLCTRIELLATEVRAEIASEAPSQGKFAEIDYFETEPCPYDPSIYREKLE
jgi:hypothetical protein